mmetsp:Transcript_17620/g.28846  ORF Transcript_17620/g.28846 Transcript_17620/m.28846 type:complete len:274 (-) Transcript_17620:220-1041(-)
MVVEATAPPAEEILPVESEPKAIDQITTAPSIITVANEEAAESRDDVTPSSARNEFIFSPQPPKTVSKSKSSESVKAEEAPVEAADEKEEAVAVEEPAAEEPATEEPAVEEPAIEEPAIEEVAEETPAEKEVEEKTAPVEGAAPAKGRPSMFSTLLEKATALCGSSDTATLFDGNDLDPTTSLEAKDSDVVPAKAESDVIAGDDEEVEEPSEEDQKAAEEIVEEPKVEEPKVEEQSKEEEPTPVVEAPEKKKMSMSQKLKKMFGCTSKPQVVE